MRLRVRSCRFWRNRRGSCNTRRNRRSTRAKSIRTSSRLPRESLVSSCLEQCIITTRRTAAKSSRGLLTTSGAAKMRITANTSTTGTSPSVGRRLLARSSMSMRSPSWRVADACSCCRTWRGRQRLAKVLRMRQRTPWTRRPRAHLPSLVALDIKG